MNIWAQQVSSKLKFAYYISTTEPVVSYDYFSYEVKVTIDDLVLDSFIAHAGSASYDWKEVEIDLSDYIGEIVSLEISAGWTNDTLFSTWVYIDAPEN